MRVREIGDDEVAFFQEHGWAHLPDLLDREAIARLYDRAQDLYRNNKHLTGFSERVERSFRSYPGEDQTSPPGVLHFLPSHGA